ncbi:MAG: CDP-diacylglycerol--serine O-phosphatidyltransferase [Acidobacteria bacterium]|nr:MAG: CDP-diacylglycerol--serine O-phosphatidyltransferase [Acidobacteriota bacterium]
MSEDRKKSRKFRRGIYILPTLFTIGTIFCGFYALINTMKGEFDLAAIAIGLAVVFDGMDGRIARLTNSCSEFGVQMDSLADVVTFGLAPSVLAYIWGLKSIAPTLPSYAKHVQQIGWIVCFAFLICGTMRLARFNIQTTKQQSSSAQILLKRSFIGMPIPAGAGMIAAIIHFVPEPINHWSVGALWNILIGFLAFLMISTIRYPSFKDIDLRNRKSYINVYLLAMLMALIYLYSQVVLLVLATVYACSGLLAKVYNLLKHRNEAILSSETLVPRTDDNK